MVLISAQGVAKSLDVGTFRKKNSYLQQKLEIRPKNQKVFLTRELCRRHGKEQGRGKEQEEEQPPKNPRVQRREPRPAAGSS